jgi:hypothetical protein
VIRPAALVRQATSRTPLRKGQALRNDEAEALPVTLAQGIRALDAAVDGRGRDHMYPDE